MTTDYMRYFVAVAEKLNFTKAAEACHIAQTAMSRCIVSLEMEVGVELVKRSKHSVILTPAGQVFSKQIKELLQQYDTLIASTRQVTAAEQQTLHIVMGYFTREIALQLVSRCQARCPDIRFVLDQCDYSVMPELLQKGQLNASFCIPGTERKIEYAPNHNPSYRQHPLQGFIDMQGFLMPKSA